MTPDEIREQVRTSRRDQGLPDTIPGRFLDDLAAQVLDQGEDTDLDEAVRYDEDNPEHVAWMKEIRALLAD